MYKIALFAPILTSTSPALEKYIEFYQQQLCDNPIIFCDRSDVYIDHNIPIFSSLYIKQKFNDYIIVTDIENINCIDDSTAVIAVYNANNKINTNKHDNIYYLANNFSIKNIIEEIKHEKLPIDD